MIGAANGPFDFSRLVGVLGERNDGDFGIESVFLLDDAAHGFGVEIAVENKEFDTLVAERLAEVVRPTDPVTVGRVARVPERAVNQRDVVLVLGQNGN